MAWDDVFLSHSRFVRLNLSYNFSFYWWRASWWSRHRTKFIDAFLFLRCAARTCRKCMRTFSLDLANYFFCARANCTGIYAAAALCNLQPLWCILNSIEADEGRGIQSASRTNEPIFAICLRKKFQIFTSDAASSRQKINCSQFKIKSNVLVVQNSKFFLSQLAWI